MRARPGLVILLILSCVGAALALQRLIAPSEARPEFAESSNRIPQQIEVGPNGLPPRSAVGQARILLAHRVHGTDTPLTDASVLCRSFPSSDPWLAARPGGDGSFALPIAAPGSYAVRVTSDGFVPYDGQIRIATLEDSVTILMLHLASIHARVADADGNPIRGAMVRVQPLPPGQSQDPDSLYTLRWNKRSVGTLTDDMGFVKWDSLRPFEIYAYGAAPTSIGYGEFLPSTVGAARVDEDPLEITIVIRTAMISGNVAESRDLSGRVTLFAVLDGYAGLDAPSSLLSGHTYREMQIAQIGRSHKDFAFHVSRPGEYLVRAQWGDGATIRLATRYIRMDTPLSGRDLGELSVADTAPLEVQFTLDGTGVAELSSSDIGSMTAELSVDCCPPIHDALQYSQWISDRLVLSVAKGATLLGLSGEAVTLTPKELRGADLSDLLVDGVGSSVTVHERGDVARIPLRLTSTFVAEVAVAGVQQAPTSVTCLIRDKSATLQKEFTARASWDSESHTIRSRVRVPSGHYSLFVFWRSETDCHSAYSEDVVFQPNTPVRLLPARTESLVVRLSKVPAKSDGVWLDYGPFGFDSAVNSLKVRPSGDLCIQGMPKDRPVLVRGLPAGIELLGGEGRVVVSR